MTTSLEHWEKVNEKFILKTKVENEKIVERIGAFIKNCIGKLYVKKECRNCAYMKNPCGYEYLCILHKNKYCKDAIRHCKLRSWKEKQ